MMEDNTDSSDKQTLGRSKKIKANDAIIRILRSGEPTTITRHIPQEIIEEILVRLPVKSLLRFKCVAQSWLALISSPKFIKTHAEYSTNLDPTFSNYRLMLSIAYYGSPRENLSNSLVSSVLRDFCTDVPADADRFDNRTEQQFAIHGSCNGLLCVALHCRDGLQDVFLWNPCLRMSKKLPPPLCAAEWGRIRVSRYCIVYDERNDDYKVVGLLSHHQFGSPLALKVETYSLKNDSWKAIEEPKGGLPWSFMVYAYGKLNFVASSKDNKHLSIVSLDLENEVYGNFELILESCEQQEYYSCLLSVGVLKGCITALYNYERDRAHVWILKEYGVKESWTKLVSIPYVNGPHSINLINFSYRLLFIWNGKYLLIRGSHLVVYNPEDRSFVDRSFAKGCWSRTDSAGFYVESLVPLPEMRSLVPLPEIKL